MCVYSVGVSLGSVESKLYYNWSGFEGGVDVGR